MNKEINGHFREKTVSAKGTEIFYSLNKITEISGDDVIFKIELQNLLVKSLKDASAGILDHLKNKNWPAIRSIAHKIKPNIDLLCNQDLLLKIINIEDNINDMDDLNYVNRELNEIAFKLVKLANQISENEECN